jgi:hypothetical protein
LFFLGKKHQKTCKNSHQNNQGTGAFHRKSEIIREAENFISEIRIVWNDLFLQFLAIEQVVSIKFYVILQQKAVIFEDFHPKIDIQKENTQKTKGNACDKNILHR